MTITADPSAAHDSRHFWILTLGAVGVVYGDIGTSPLYAIKESLNAARAGAAVTPEMALGVVSLVLWALIVVVTLKYVVLMLRADNDGEGGTLTLMALAQRAMERPTWLVTLLGVAGAALFYGDAIITPAISVLSAVEGLTLVTPAFEPLVLPISMVILVALFAVQSRGTGAVAAFFGPIITVWFTALATGGIVNILAEPGILAAINPAHGASFLLNHGGAGLLALGAVFLAVTGAEALYADLGHFGRGPIRTAWLGLALPALGLNYLGQGALMLVEPAAIENPFFKLYPTWALLPMVALATMATIIASQAVITGAYSITQQAIQLGLLPRMHILQTSAAERGQVYIPVINWLLLLAVLYLTAAFRSSSALASAYGIAVTGTMLVTVMLAFVIVWKLWRWPLWMALAVMTPFMLIDVIFLGANLLKIAEGGWLPLMVGGALMIVMWTWRRGTSVLKQQTQKDDLGLEEFLPTLERRGPARVPGTAVFLTSEPGKMPSAFMHNLKHNKVMHTLNIIVSVETVDTPRVERSQRAQVTVLSDAFSVVRLRFGYMEEPNVPAALRACGAIGAATNEQRLSYFLSRRALRPAAHSKLPRWQDRLFIWLARRSSDASEYFMIPTEQVIEVGTQIVV